MDCLANIRFLDALEQPLQGLAHQLWIGSTLISEYVTLENGESVWIKRPIGTTIDVRVRSSTSGEYKSKVKLQLVGEKTSFIIRSPKILLKGVKLSAKDVATGSYLRSTYIVAEGDYLSRIADDNDVTTAELIRLNNLENDTDIQPGQILKIPVKKIEPLTLPSEVKPKSQETKPTHQEKTKIIVVQQKDTLPLIAKLTGNSVDGIKKLNNLASDKLSQNQKLNVYDRKVAVTQPKAEKKPEQKPVSPPKIKQETSKNKEKAPVTKVEASVSVSSKVSERNEKQIRKLHPQVQNRVRKLIQNVYAVHQIQLVIVQSFRTYAEQDALYAQGRSNEGNIVTYAHGGESNHNFGLAVDVFPLWEDGKLHMAGKGVDAKNVKILREIGETGKTAGLMWGGDWKGKKQDNPHFELNVGKTMSQLRQAVKEAGGDPLKVKYSIK